MRTLILEPVGSACNLNCAYCYHEPVRESLKVMNDKILEKIVYEASLLGEDIKFIWHGGEPTLAGMDFFLKALNFQKRHCGMVNVLNLIQTNCTTITKEWAEFLVGNGFRVSTSLDGPEFIHDKFRCNSFKAVVKGMEELRKLTKKIGIIITVNQFNVDFPEIIWEEIIKPQIYSQSFEITIASPTEKTSFMPPNEKSLNFLKKMFDLWMQNDDPNIYIRTFMSILRGLKGGKTHLCSLSYRSCEDFVSINNHGESYMCNRFMGRKDAYLGNIIDSTLKDLLFFKKDMYREKVFLNEECHGCEWFGVCGGGCPFYKWASSGSFSGNCPDCQVKKE